MPESSNTLVNSDVGPSESIRRRAAIAAAAGNVSEWYDYAVYGFVAVQISTHFFTGGGSLAATFLVYAVSFFFRPLGGIIFGHIGDRLGRQKVLVLTFGLVALSTASIGVLPSYQTVGWLAPLLLIVCRSLQGISVGGEYVTATTFAAEYASDHKRGRIGGWIGFSSALGNCLAVAVVFTCNLVIGNQGMADWGWRVPFLLALPLGLVGIYLRLRLEDTPVFREIVATERRADAPLREALRYPRELAACAALAVMYNGPVYVATGYTVTYLQTSLNLSQSQSLGLTLAAFAPILLLSGFVGALSDRIGRRPIILTGGVGLIVLTYPIYMLMSTGKVPLVLIGLQLSSCLLMLFYATLAPTLPAIFPARVRVSGLVIGYNIPTAIFGGGAPLVVNWLVDRTGNTLSPSYYIIFCAGISLLPVYFLLKETAGQSMRDQVSSVRVDEVATHDMEMASTTVSDAFRTGDR